MNIKINISNLGGTFSLDDELKAKTILEIRKVLQDNDCAVTFETHNTQEYLPNHLVGKSFPADQVDIQVKVKGPINKTKNLAQKIIGPTLLLVLNSNTSDDLKLPALSSVHINDNKKVNFLDFSQLPTPKH